MTDVIKEDQVLDCSGMLCPLPVVKTSKAMKELQSGQILKMVATDPGAPPDMEAWSRQTGNEMLRSMTEDGKFIFYKLIDFRSAADGAFHVFGGVLNDFFQFLHQFIIVNHLLIQEL